MLKPQTTNIYLLCATTKRLRLELKLLILQDPMH